MYWLHPISCRLRCGKSFIRVDLHNTPSIPRLAALILIPIHVWLPWLHHPLFYQILDVFKPIQVRRMRFNLVSIAPSRLTTIGNTYSTTAITNFFHIILSMSVFTALAFYFVHRSPE